MVGVQSYKYSGGPAKHRSHVWWWKQAFGLLGNSWKLGTQTSTMPKLAKALVFPKESKIFLQSLTYKLQKLLDFADVERISKKSVQLVFLLLVYPNVPRQLLESSKVLGEAQYGLKSDNRRIFLVRAKKVYGRFFCCWPILMSLGNYWNHQNYLVKPSMVSNPITGESFWWGPKKCTVGFFVAGLS